MSDKINELLQKEVGFAGFFYIIALCLLSVLIIYLVIRAIKTACCIESESGVPAHSLIKSILIGILPGLYFGLSEFDITMPKSIILIASIAVVLIVAIWNFRVFGIFGGIVLTFVHCLYAFLLVLCIMSIAFIILAGAVLFIATAASGSSATTPSSGSVPSSLRDLRTGERFHVSRLDGSPRIDRYGTWVLIRSTDFSGRYIDDYGNEYVQ